MDKKYFKMLLILFLMPALFSWGKILEVQDIRELQEHVHPEALILFDLDNTVIEPEQNLGGDQWFSQRIKDHLDQGLEKNQALSKALIEWVGLQSVIQMKLVQDEAKELIENLQSEGVALMGLTTRGPDTYYVTLDHLEHLGVDFKHTAPYDKKLVFMNEGEGVIFHNGVLFTANSQKGKALFTFLEHANYQPKHIIFINDKQKNLEAVKVIADERGVPFLGLRYGYLDQKVADYDHNLAMKQFFHYKEQLKNEQFHAIAREHEAASQE